MAIGSDASAPHLHPAQDERFTVHEGELHAELEGREVVLGAGDVLEIPRDTAHRMWPEGGQVRATWETSPQGRTGDWFRAIDVLRRESPGNEPGLGDLAVLVTEYADTFCLAVEPSGPPPTT